MGVSMRTDRYRFTLWLERGEANRVAAVELYDHLEDPGENVNLAGDPGRSALIERLTGELGALSTPRSPRR